MKKFLLTLFIILNMTSPILAQGFSSQDISFTIENALKNKDEQAILKLFNWEGVSDEAKSSQELVVRDLLRKDIDHVVLARLPDDYRSEYVIGGLHYVPNIEIEGLVEVYLKPGSLQEKIVFPYGKKDNTYYLANTVVEKIKN